MSLLDVRGITKRFGGLLAVYRLDLDVREGEVHALIGPNGAGKSTLVSLISGLLQPDGGEIWLDGRNITRLPPWKRFHLGLGRTFQIVNIFPGRTVQENLVIALLGRHKQGGDLWRPVASRGHILREAEELASFFGLEERFGEKVDVLSHGERRLVELALALAGRSRLLLLDEPLAGLGAEEAERVKAAVRRIAREASVLLVEHDMDAVFQLAHRISVMVYGSLLATGSPEEVRSNPQVQQAYLGEYEPLA
ncbi:ABC transporter ATP-binding protein [Thermus sp.]|uniref:ABC transporter ATP-binding protein n=1 Tax=Thermus sp. TaxID=275 RepID=UPI0025E5AA94|nr:ABC transporter ATP-binding protein [Thermus sp.]MCS6867756.1 ABC transporter ATP-binding protein [Thermus sp.]